MAIETVETSLPETAPAKSYVVGLGASAGGLEALTAVVKNLPPKLGCVYVVAQHMSASHRSLMAEILGRETSLPVLEAKQGVCPKKDTIYIVPAGANLVLSKGMFRLTTPPPELSPKPSINALFQSIAQEYGELGIGVVLSGTGSDGTRGLLAIKAAGGLTMAQLPESAKYDGMPRSAIDAQVVDRIVTPENIGSDLERLVYFADLPQSDEALPLPPDDLALLFSKVKDHTRIDFSSYKLSTVQRRLQRRMLACRTDHLQDYLHYIELHPEELEALAKETLISVTEFFRDKEAFSAFERICADVVASKQNGDEIRVWIIGCATGEEAYSVGITFLELIRQAGLRVRLNLFATDVDNDALAVARRGVYSMAAMTDIPAQILERYFQPIGEGFEPVKALRDCVTFARQDVAADPPFLRLDVVTCRNVLIYFNSDLQSKVMSIIRYSLKDSGVLFLGRSETVSKQDSLFAVADRRARIFRCKMSSGPITIGTLSSVTTKTGNIAFVRKPARTHEQMFSQALANFVGPAMLVDSATRILHSHGSVGKLLAFPSGSPEMNLAQLIVPELSGELLATLQRSNRGKEPVASRRRRILSLKGETWRLVIRPASNPGESNLFLVVFEEGKGHEVDNEKAASVPAPLELDLSNELDSAREQLQALTEEMAASNEEMQALNEEIQAANEELQASNEELEAANEELQATNEELLSVNEESQVKSSALAAINSEFESMYNTLDFPVLVFDTTLSLRRINGAAVRCFSMPMTNVGHHISRLKLPDYLSDITDVLQEVVGLGTKRTLAREQNERVYQLQINPVMSASLSVLGVVLVALDNTDLVSALSRIRESQEQLAAIMQNSTSAVSLKDASGRYEFVNRRFEELFALQAADVIGKTDAQLFGAIQSATLRGNDLDTMRSPEPLERTERIEVAGVDRWLQSTRFQILDANGVVRSICTESSDITDKRQALMEQRLAAQVFDHAGEAIAVLDQQGLILRVNQSFIRITGFSSEEVLGTSMEQLLSEVQGPDFYGSVVSTVQKEGVWQGEVSSRRKSGDLFPQWLTASRVLMHEHPVAIENYVLMFSDITAIKNSQQRVEFIATHDELTGLPNRRLLTDRLKHALSMARRNATKVALLFIDLDNFKKINDGLGHDVGDMLLVQAAQRLDVCLRDSDTLARLGGDEFVAVLERIQLPELETIARRIIDTMSASFSIQGQLLFVSASIGISVFPEDGDDSIALLKNADTAMYSAKEKGRNQFQYFANDMKVAALQRLTLESGLREALVSNRLFMVYQPKLSLVDQRLVGVEALLRWQDPLLGSVPPATFIPLAESTGLIIPLGYFSIRQVVADIASWNARGLQVPRVAINVSAYQLREADFLERVQAILTEFQVPASAICLELTESALMMQLDKSTDSMLRCAELGIELSVDDFGTGYSSLSYLRRLPIHELKVDQSFVAGIATEPDDRSIAKMIINMAHTLGLRVVAEGVETAEQVAVLKAEGCEIAQGYFFYQPLSAQAIAELLLPTTLTPEINHSHA